MIEKLIVTLWYLFGLSFLVWFGFELHSKKRADSAVRNKLKKVFSGEEKEKLAKARLLFCYTPITLCLILIFEVLVR